MAADFHGRISGIPAVKSRLQKLGQGLSREEATEIGRGTLRAILDLVERGISPIRGGGLGGKFPPYKNPKRYPGKRKPHTPVNLWLSGKFLRSLKYRVLRFGKGYVAEIGFTSELSELKERGHRERANGQPKRPIIPVATNGERFARLVEDAYLKVVSQHIKRLVKS